MHPRVDFAECSSGQPDIAKQQIAVSSLIWRRKTVRECSFQRRNVSWPRQKRLSLSLQEQRVSARQKAFVSVLHNTYLSMLRVCHQRMRPYHIGSSAASCPSNSSSTLPCCLFQLIWRVNGICFKSARSVSAYLISML